MASILSGTHKQKLYPLKYAYDSQQWHYMSVTTSQITDSLCNGFFSARRKRKATVTSRFPLRSASYAEKVSMAWRHHVCFVYDTQYNDVVMGAMASQSPALRLFTQSFIQAQIKENITALRHWPLCKKTKQKNPPKNSGHMFEETKSARVLSQLRPNLSLSCVLVACWNVLLWGECRHWGLKSSWINHQQLKVNICFD